MRRGTKKHWKIGVGFWNTAIFLNIGIWRLSKAATTYAGLLSVSAVLVGGAVCGLESCFKSSPQRIGLQQQAAETD